MNFKSWLLISEMAKPSIESLKTKSLQALSKNEPDPVKRERYQFLVAEWDGPKNKKELNITPNDVMQKSNKKINWKCKKGHSWAATLNNRTSDGNNCHCCSKQNKKVCDDNNLQYLSKNEPDPEKRARYQFLVAEWDKYNNILSPNDVTPNSNKKINWKCKKGHSWTAIINGRTSDGNNCPCCSNQQLCDDNNLQYLSKNEPDPVKRERYQILVAEWDGSKNKKELNITPNDVMPNSNKMINWKCLQKEHKWAALVVSRTKGNNCPCCSNQQLCDDNNLQYLSENEPDPEKRARYQFLVAEWDKDNNILTPSDVTSGSGEKINWKCKKGHSWPAQVYNRTGSNARNCPICNESKGEEEVFKVLQNYISPTQITRQYKDIDCRGDCLPLPFDLMVKINDKKYFIEYNGEQHYRPTFGSTPDERQSNFEKRQRYDKVKLEYCRNKNIPFLVIPYTKYKNIDTIISSFLKTKTFDSKFAELEL
jgi:uncharacterized protein with NRDE domain